MIHRFRDRFTVEELCKLLEVSRSGYYKWLKRKDEPDKDKVIADLIVECHEKRTEPTVTAVLRFGCFEKRGLSSTTKQFCESCANTICLPYESANGFGIMIATLIPITTTN